MSDRPIAFVDTETTGLHPDRKAWEIAVIRREPDGREQAVTILVADVDLRDADPKALEIGQFDERHHRPTEFDGTVLWEPEWNAANLLLCLLRDATIVGAQPHFDAETLRMLLDRHGHNPPWHYRLRCVESLVAGWNGTDVGGLATCMAALELPFSKDVQHTAMGDAVAVRAIWDHLIG